MNHGYYPVALDVGGKRCLVVGGGTIATDKVEGLLLANARVTVVSPTVADEIERRAARGEVDLRLRPFETEDLDGIYLAYGATDDKNANARVAAEGRARGLLVNAVDDIPNCDFFAMAITRRRDLQVAVSTSGRSPALARWVREYLDCVLAPELGDLLDLLGDIRDELKARGPIPPYEDWHEAIADDVFQRLRDGDREGARRLLLQVLGPAAEAHRDLVAAGAGS